MPDQNQATAWSIRLLPDQNQAAEQCKFQNQALPDIRLPDIRRLPDRSGTCQIKIRRQPDQSGGCLIKIRQLPDQSGPRFVRSLFQSALRNGIPAVAVAGAKLANYWFGQHDRNTAPQTPPHHTLHCTTCATRIRITPHHTQHHTTHYTVPHTPSAYKWLLTRNHTSDY